MNHHSMKRIVTRSVLALAAVMATPVTIAFMFTACGGAADTGIEGPANNQADGQVVTTSDGSKGEPDGSVVGKDGATDAPPPPITTKVSCAVDAGATGDEADPDPASKRAVTGTNGTFEDACDNSGNLVKQSCDTRLICDAPPNPSCVSVETGAVKSTNIDCAGLCVSGTCASDCPVVGDELEVKANAGDGNITFRNKRDARSYGCKLIFQQPNVAYDCKKAPFAASLQIVKSLGLRGRYCTGKAFGNIGTSPTTISTSTQTCSWTCDIIP